MVEYPKSSKLDGVEVRLSNPSLYRTCIYKLGGEDPMMHVKGVLKFPRFYVNYYDPIIFFLPSVYLPNFYLFFKEICVISHFLFF